MKQYVEELFANEDIYFFYNIAKMMVINLYQLNLLSESKKIIEKLLLRI